MAMFHLGFVHANLLDLAEGSDAGPSWNRECRLADSLIETSSRFDDLFEPVPDDAQSEIKPEPPRGGPGGLLATLRLVLGHGLAKAT